RDPTLFPYTTLFRSTREMVEVIDKENSLRYVLRKNDFRAEQMAETRAEKMVSLEKKIEKSNLYLNEHPRAKPSVQERNLKAFLADRKSTRLNSSHVS